MPRKHMKYEEFEPIEAALVSRSSLTELQLAVARAFIERRYYISKVGKSSKYRIKEGSKGVSKGTFFRVLGQAKANVKRVLYTMILLSFYEMIDERTIENIITTGSLLKQVTQTGPPLTGQKLREVLQSVEESMSSEMDNIFVKQ